MIWLADIVRSDTVANAFTVSVFDILFGRVKLADFPVLKVIFLSEIQDLPVEYFGVITRFPVRPLSVLRDTLHVTPFPFRESGQLNVRNVCSDVILNAAEVNFSVFVSV